MTNLDILVAGQEKLKELQNFGETLASSTRREDDRSIGETLVKILTIIAGIFLIIAATCVSTPEILFAAIPVVILSGALLIKNAQHVANFCSKLLILRIFSEPKRRNTIHHIHHHPRNPQWGVQRKYPMRNTSYGSQIPDLHDIFSPPFSPLQDPRSSVGPFAAVPQTEYSRSAPPTPSPQQGVSFGGSGRNSATFGAGWQSHSAFGGGHADSSTTVGADGKAQVAFGAGHDRSSKPTGQVPFGERNN